jgi:RNA polymerase sigma-70 factor (ECF subfamily)
MLAADTGFEIHAEVGSSLMATNVEELESLVSKDLPKFYRRAFRQLGNAHDAEDAVQDALLSAYQHLSQFKGQAQLSTWLTMIVINASRMQRRRRRGSHVSLDQQINEEGGTTTLLDAFPDDGPDPEEICRYTELRERLSELVEQLTPSLRRAFQLRHVDGLSTREAAEVLGVAEGTVKAQLARARAKLIRLMREALGMPRSPMQVCAAIEIAGDT